MRCVTIGMRERTIHSRVYVPDHGIVPDQSMHPLEASRRDYLSLTVCCSVLQQHLSLTVCCSVLQQHLSLTVCCSVLQQHLSLTVCCSVLQQHTESRHRLGTSNLVVMRMEVQVVKHLAAIKLDALIHLAAIKLVLRKDPAIQMVGQRGVMQSCHAIMSLHLRCHDVIACAMS